MPLINFIEIKTKSGYSEFELHAADITKLGFDVDLIAISAYKGSYVPTPGSVIQSFYEQGVKVEALAKEPLLDLRDSFGTWVSEPFNKKNFKNLICLEIGGTGFTFEEAIRNLFSVLSVLEIKGYRNKTIALPMLGTGNQRISPKEIVPILVNQALDFLMHARYLKKVIFVVRDEQQAEELNEVMDMVLGRSNVRVPHGPMIDGLKSEILRELDKIEVLGVADHHVKELKRIISGECRSFDLGVNSRKMVEFILSDISPEYGQSYSLLHNIRLLDKLGIAKWVQSYMHVLREFGNAEAHSATAEKRNPENMTAKDLEVCLFCLQRVLDFYNSYKSQYQLL
ncbi:DUF4145 domain-containing protein [Pontibacter chinhatensis]|uniref:O-acetyl-ADP-ribose deacetylase (Regulator of RNase III), contains Macro domain n=1 Tax=Pontibacter chinhatensis TaxID=1436961 RepID=A0A1I2QJC8_9BACT|nr:DUF4145 domain-containing protein [Pontibacter chinhatensis]SFG28705.1 O-acetyl-ADP-ribose deacetylase (regulator of RNase III), contains Macro domain [Pontibacter chinhatensis]